MNSETSSAEMLYPCVGICLPDEDEAYCIGCGRPWGAPVVLPSQPPTEPGGPAPDPPGS
jgi:hypothetical protein